MKIKQQMLLEPIRFNFLAHAQNKKILSEQVVQLLVTTAIAIQLLLLLQYFNSEV